MNQDVQIPPPALIFMGFILVSHKSRREHLAHFFSCRKHIKIDKIPRRDDNVIHIIFIIF